MKSEVRRELNLLEALEQDGRVTQRTLAAKLGMALGLTNLYLKRLIRKGYVKCVNVRPNRIGYLITPTGVVEKARLAREYMEQSLTLYRDIRGRFREEMHRKLNGDRPRVAIYGTGEAAELAYLCLKELGLDPVAVFDGDAGGAFLGMPVQPVDAHDGVGYDLMVVATIGDCRLLVADLTRAGVERRRLILLRDS